jgi:ubiquinol-cytochrome c reductase cytochrome b subunit
MMRRLRSIRRGPSLPPSRAERASEQQAAPVTADGHFAAREPVGDDEPTELERLIGWVDSRTGAAGVLRTALRKVFPDHWSFLLGEVALFCFVILVATGTFLTFFYVPSAAPVPYDGPWVPLQGQEVSAAFDSVMALSLEVKAGLLMRQIHHWTALVFVGIVVLHLCRVFFTGAFRRPREINWIVGFTLLLLAMAEGFTGYSLPDDLLSGTGARIAYSAALSIPFIGPWVASLLFGGEFPTGALISRFFVIHVMLLPGAFIGAIGLHLVFVYLHKHTQYRGEPATEENVVGRPFWPTQAFLSTGLFFLTAAVVALIGGVFQVNPIWAYGPFDAAQVSSPAQPDWYVGWLDGALRIWPPFEPTILGVTIPAAFVPGVIVPGILFTLVAIWPFVEARLDGDDREHHLLDRYWERPIRTATGVALLTVFGVLTLAGGNDVIAFYFSTEVEALTNTFRVLTIVLPPLAWILTWRFCRSRRDRAVGQVGEDAPPRGGTVLRRTATGGFEEGEL